MEQEVFGPIDVVIQQAGKEQLMNLVGINSAGNGLLSERILPNHLLSLQEKQKSFSMQENLQGLMDLSLTRIKAQILQLVSKTPPNTR